MRICLALLTLLLLLPPARLTAAEIYRYTDERGVIHFVSAPNDVPERYRQRARLVQGQVSRTPDSKLPAPGSQPAARGSDPVAMLRSGLEFFNPYLNDLDAGALSPTVIVAVELWRSRVVFSLVGLLAMGGLFLLGLRYTRDVPAGQRGRHRLRLSVSFAVVLVLFWLSLFGPGLGRMLRGCGAEAGRSIELAADDSERVRLERFRQLSERAADAVERLLVTTPA